MEQDSGRRAGVAVRRLICPKCGGGATKERSFVQHDTWFKCYRASCGYGSGGKAPSRAYVYEQPKTYELDALTLRTLHERYCLSHDTSIAAGLRLVRPGRLYVPMLTIEGVLYGHEERNIEGPKKPYTSVSSSPVGSWLVHDRKRVALVEDALSQARMWQAGLSCQRLSGTELHDIQNVQLFDEALVCLDRDASHKAIRMSRHLGNARPVLLGKDIKDQTEEEFEHMRKTWAF